MDEKDSPLPDSLAGSRGGVGEVDGGGGKLKDSASASGIGEEATGGGGGGWKSGESGRWMNLGGSILSTRLRGSV